MRQTLSKHCVEYFHYIAFIEKLTFGFKVKILAAKFWLLVKCFVPFNYVKW